MTAINHGLTGVAIGTIVQSPWALPLALLSHFLLDAIPHFGLAKRNTIFLIYLFFDALATATLLFWVILTTSQPLLLASCLILATSPDLVWAYKWFKEVKHNQPFSSGSGPITRFHTKIQWFEKPVGIIVEVFWAAAMLLIITNNLA